MDVGTVIEIVGGLVGVGATVATLIYGRRAARWVTLARGAVKLVEEWADPATNSVPPSPGNPDGTGPKPKRKAK
jgi:hypothetical protein